MSRILRLVALAGAIVLFLPLLFAQEPPNKPDKDPAAKTVKPDKDKPVDPDLDKPVDPDLDKPAKPDKNKPAKPDKNKPAKLDKNKPVDPDLDKPVKPDKDKPVKPDKAAPKEKLVFGNKVTGKITHWDANQQSMTVQVTIPYKALNEGAARQLAQLQVQFYQARTLQDRFNIQQQMLQQQAILYQIKEEKRDVDVQTAKDLKIRLHSPPTTFDEKGRAKKPTKKELDELKGPDPRLPGYLGDLKDIRQDSYVTIFFAPRKKTTNSVGGKPAKTDEDKPTVDSRPEILMILIYPDIVPAGKS